MYVSTQLKDELVLNSGFSFSSNDCLKKVKKSCVHLLLPNNSGENRWIYVFSKGISMKWTWKVSSSNWTKDNNSISYNANCYSKCIPFQYLYMAYLNIYIYIYCHPQTDCFIVSQLFSVARHAGIETCPTLH